MCSYENQFTPLLWPIVRLCTKGSSPGAPENAILFLIEALSAQVVHAVFFLMFWEPKDS